MRGVSIIVLLIFIVSFIAPVDALSYEKVYPKKYDTVKGKMFYRSIVGANGHAICLKNYKNAKDPTLLQVTAFLKTDKTDQKIYSEKTFKCTDYAEALHNAAEAKGLKAGFVSIEFENTETGHALNCFQTTSGIIYVDCCGSAGKAGKDRFSYPEVGKNYTVVTLDGKNSDLGKTVRSIQIFW